MLCPELLLVAHLASHHFKNREFYEESNPGIAIECRDKISSIAAGTFRNSFGDQSLYATVALNLRVPYVVTGPAIGLASGYGEVRNYRICNNGTCRDYSYNPDNDIIPILGWRLNVPLGDKWELGVFASPHINLQIPGFVHGTIAYSFGAY